MELAVVLQVVLTLCVLVQHQIFVSFLSGQELKSHKNPGVVETIKAKDVPLPPCRRQGGEDL
jgi:hypothetical protein